MSLVTVAEVKAIGRIDYDTHDTELQLLIDGAESYIEQYCVLRLTSRTVTDERQDGGNAQLWPEQLPITAVASVKDTWNDDEAVDSTLYFNSETRIIADEGSRWADGELRYKVTYTAGYTTITVPAALKNLIIGLTLLHYNNAEGRKSQKAKDVTITWDRLAEGNINSQLDQFSFRRYVE